MTIKGVKVWGLVVILVVVGSIFSGVVSAENVSEDLTKSATKEENQMVFSYPVPDSEKVSQTITAAIDQQLLDLIDQYASTYYKSSWNLNIEQYKAWIATIAWAEGGRGGYVAHSQGALGSDRFDHRTVGSSFRFSTGIGPFQLDRGGGSENWGLWPTIDKLDPEKAVISVLRRHYNLFGSGSTLEVFASNSPWYAVNPTQGGNPSAHWSAVTGTNWNTHKTGKTSLDWSSIKSQLALNANSPSYRYENNVNAVGTVNWNIKESEGIKTDSGKNVIFDGLYQTWLITSRSWSGTELFKYYYTQRSDEKIEVWVWDNSNDPVNKFKYIFVREYSTGPLPERRSGSVAGETLQNPALFLISPPTLISPPNNSHQTSSITFQWTSVSSATNYEISVKFPDSSSWLSDQTTSTSYPYSPTLIGEYHWKVRAYVSGSWSDYSDEWIFYFDGAPAPTLISPPNNAEITVLRPTFQWNSVPGSISYQLQLARDSSFTDMVRYNLGIASTSWQLDTDLTAGQTYYWRVRSGIPIGFWSTVWHFTVVPPPSIDLAPSSYDFGSIEAGQCSSEYSFTLTNTGGGTATGSVSLTGTHADQFTITQGSGSFSLSAGASKTIKVKFCPTSTGAKSAILYADGTNCNGDSSTLSGTGTPPQRTITFYTDPTDGGTITFDAVTYNNGQSTTKADGNYPVSANPASNYKFDHWSTTGGVSVANSSSQSTTATVSGDGSLKAWFTYTPPQHTITIGDAQAPMGSCNTSTIMMNITDPTGLGAATINLTYNQSVCVVTNVVKGPSSFDTLTSSHLYTNTSGYVRMVASQAGGTGVGLGLVKFADVTLKAVGSFGEESMLNLSVETLKNNSGVSISYTVINGTFKIGVKGDYSGDGVKDAWDCTYLARHLAGIPGYGTIYAGDISGDGVVDSWDCTYLARHLAGIPGYEDP